MSKYIKRCNSLLWKKKVQPSFCPLKGKGFLSRSPPERGLAVLQLEHLQVLPAHLNLQDYKFTRRFQYHMTFVQNCLLKDVHLTMFYSF